MFPSPWGALLWPFYSSIFPPPLWPHITDLRKPLVLSMISFCLKKILKYHIPISKCSHCTFTGHSIHALVPNRSQFCHLLLFNSPTTTAPIWPVILALLQRLCHWLPQSSLIHTSLCMQPEVCTQYLKPLSSFTSSPASSTYCSNTTKLLISTQTMLFTTSVLLPRLISSAFP